MEIEVGGIFVEDELDNEGELFIDSGYPGCYLDKDQAIALITHIQEVFAL